MNDPKIKPPKLADRFFKWYCRNDLRESILGDLHEGFFLDSQKGSLFRAKMNYWGCVLQFINRHTLRRNKNQHYKQSNYLSMIRISLVTSYRNILKNLNYSLLNVIGLAVGMASFVAITTYVNYERSYDDFHPAIDELYRISSDYVVDDQIETSESMSFAPLGKVLIDEFPEVARYTTVRKHFETTSFMVNDNVFGEDLVLAVDENFLQLFDHPSIAGSVDRLSEPNTIVLTRSVADKFFDRADPIGQFVEIQTYWQQNGPFEIVGIVEDVPSNTHLKFDVLISISSMRQRTERDAWDCTCYYTYVRTTPHADIDALRTKMAGLSPKYLGEERNLKFSLHPVKDIHLKSIYTFEPEPIADADTINFLEIIAWFILFIACINYVNLSTARAVNRFREVGIKKVLGASKSQVFTQFLTEAFLLNLIATLIALVIVQALKPLIFDLTSVELGQLSWNNPALWYNLLFLFVVSSLASGIYPSKVLATLNPGRVVKGNKSGIGGNSTLRKGLITFQYVVSFALIAGTLVVYQQLSYMKGHGMGIDTEQVIVIKNPVFPESQSDLYSNRFSLFQNQLRQSSFVLESGYAYAIPGTTQTEISNSYGVRIEGMEAIRDMAFYYTPIDEGFIPSLNAELIAGRNFNKQLAIDTAAVMFNETFVKMLGITNPSSLINKKVQFGVSPNARRWLIAGIVKDFNRMNLKNAIEPMVFLHNPVEDPLGYGYQLIKLSDGDTYQALDHVERLWQDIFPETPFESQFLDHKIEQVYQSDRIFGILFTVFSVIALVISGLGLVGLSSYIALQRTKEIGVRKVLGASLSSVLQLLCRQFILLFALGSVICTPLIYLVMSDWLEGYAFRIDYPWISFILAAFILLTVTLLTISRQTIKAALTNPASVLRDE